MRRYFPGFRWADVAVLAAMIAILHALARWGDAGVVMRDGLIPALCVVAYAVWSWRRR
jgi:hypothetical protein